MFFLPVCYKGDELQSYGYYWLLGSIVYISVLQSYGDGIYSKAFACEKHLLVKKEKKKVKTRFLCESSLSLVFLPYAA